MRQTARPQHDRVRSISPVLLVMLSALLMLTVAACNKNQNSDAVGAPPADRATTDETIESPPPEDGVVPPADLYEGSETEDATQKDELNPSAGQPQTNAPASAAQRASASTLSSEDARDAARKLDGHWLLDADATLELLPEEHRDALREVFGQVRTGVNFSKEGDAVMNVIAEGESNEQEGKYAVVDAAEEAVRIEFLIDDPALAEHDVHIFATLVFDDENTVRYQAYTEEQGQVVQREQVAVMKRVSKDEYNSVLK